MIDNVNHPSHYTSDKSGVECIEITRHRNFNIGNAIKYLWRAGLKGGGNSTKEIEDLKKAIFYITREIENIEDDIADAEEELSTWTTSDYSKKLYDEILDSALSAEEFDDLAAAKADHPAGKGIRVEDCEVVEDDYCWDDGPCNICAEDDRDLRPTPPTPLMAWLIGGKKYADNSKLIQPVGEHASDDCPFC